MVAPQLLRSGAWMSDDGLVVREFLAESRESLDRLFEVSVSRVQEVLRFQAMTHVPLVPTDVRGLITCAATS
jgi:hypothetical protein